jgi:transcriptional regulator with XRE-family HTH domain
MPLEAASPLGQRIRILRKSRGWSAIELHRRANRAISRSDIASLETGRRKDISLTQAVALAKAFRITVDLLVADENPVEAVVIAAEIAAARKALRQALAQETA